MPENKAFWTIYGWMGEAAKRLDIKLSARQNHRVTNAYVSILSDEEYDNLHADPTGEAAVRNVMRWLEARVAA